MAQTVLRVTTDRYTRWQHDLSSRKTRQIDTKGPIRRSSLTPERKYHLKSQAHVHASSGIRTHEFRDRKKKTLTVDHAVVVIGFARLVFKYSSRSFLSQQLICDLLLESETSFTLK
jgi:hypothetical protein